MAEQWNVFKDKADVELSKFKILQLIEEKTKLSKVYFVLIFLAISFLLVVYGWGAQLICNFVGFIYPAFASFKAIESVNKDDDTQWLVYWVVFATFCVLEYFVDIIISWFPFYFIFKFLFLLYLHLPTGATGLYNFLIRPVLLKVDETLDPLVQKHKSKIIQKLESSKPSSKNSNSILDKINNKLESVTNDVKQKLEEQLEDEENQNNMINYVAENVVQSFNTNKDD
eukprot:TRINITY_DN15004_c0_g1_i1.p1 TRINITY_DN15004_c0_g1~~TRINITY_DN15004_c0_g1_i1.p1  ORF type:complete len:227 (+),score=55.04 TRINITY_DN15004_c0_g1_i1:42-722(+)